MLQCVAVCCSVSCGGIHDIMANAEDKGGVIFVLQCVALCCSVLQCVAVLCIVRVVVCYNIFWEELWSI